MSWCTGMLSGASAIVNAKAGPQTESAAVVAADSG
jgi:hypothetical protein